MINLNDSVVMIEDLHIQSMLQEAWVLRGAGNYKQAVALVDKAQSLCADTQHAHLGRIFHIRAQFASDHDDPVTALAHSMQALDHYRKSENQDKVAHTTRHIADLQRRLGKLEVSESNYRTAIEIYKDRVGTSTLDLANALRGFGVVLELLGKDKEAITTWEETRKLYSSLGLEEGVDEATLHLVALGAESDTRSYPQ